MNTMADEYEYEEDEREANGNKITHLGRFAGRPVEAPVWSPTTGEHR